MSNKHRVLIAEDKPEFRKLMRKLIPLVHSSFEVVEEAVDGEDFIDKVFTVQPDLIFLDIDMPKKSGIEAVTEIIKVKPDLKFVFTTAYDHFALEAFGLKAMDYIVKPIKKERLYDVLETAHKILYNQTTQNQLARSKRIPIKSSGSQYFVPLEEIIFIEKQDRKTVIHLINEQISTNDTLEDLQSYLDDRFYQSHRSFIINLTMVYKIRPSGQSYMVSFDNYEHAAQISKNYIKGIQQKMEEFL